MICPECLQHSLVHVAVMHNINFYSCNNEECLDHADVILDMGNEGAPSYVKYCELVQALNGMKVEDMQDDQLMIENNE